MSRTRSVVQRHNLTRLHVIAEQSPNGGKVVRSGRQVDCRGIESDSGLPPMIGRRNEGLAPEEALEGKIKGHGGFSYRYGAAVDSRTTN